MDKLLASSGMKNASVDYKRKAKETASSEETTGTARNSELEEDSKDTKSIFEQQKEEQEINNWKFFVEQMKIGRQRANITKALNYSASNELSRLAAADNIAVVNNIAAQVRIKMNRVRRSGAKQEQIASVLGQMSGVLGKARVKASRLRIEMQIERSKEQAQEQKNELEEEKLERELRRKKRNRTSQENNDILEAKSKEPYNTNNAFDRGYSTDGGGSPILATSHIPVPLPTIDTVTVGDVGTGEITSTMDITL